MFWVSFAQARTKVALSDFYNHSECAISHKVCDLDFLGVILPGVRARFRNIKFVLHGRCKDILTFGGLKREFRWQAPGIGHLTW